MLLVRLKSACWTANGSTFIWYFLNLQNEDSCDKYLFSSSSFTWDAPTLLRQFIIVIYKPQRCHTLYGDIFWLLAYDFLLLLSLPSSFPLPLLLSHLCPLGFQWVINTLLICTIQPAWVFISSCHILAASIISHCKAIWVLITGGVHRWGDPSTSHMYIAHADAGMWASSAIHVSATSLQCIMRWYSRKLL